MTKNPPRIVLGVTHSRSLRLMSGLPERLVEAGWDVHLVSDDGFLTTTYDGTPITMHRVAMERQPSLRADLRALRSWTALIRELSPEIVFVGTPKAGVLGILAAWFNNVPHRVYHLRGLRLESTVGVTRILYWLIEKLTFSFATRAIAVSGSLKQRVMNLRLVRAPKILVLGSGSSNGVDIRHFKPSDKSEVEIDDLGLQPGVPVIGFVGRMSKDKGSHELSTASHILKQRNFDHQLLIIGSHENEDKTSDFMTNISGYKPVFTGQVSDTSSYYRFMDLLCLPTHREGFPNVVLEAGASGVATVTTYATGAVDSVIDGVTGRLVRVGDSLELADVLMNLLEDHRQRTMLGLAARRHVEENFTREAIQDDLVDFLNKILG